MERGTDGDGAATPGKPGRYAVRSVANPQTPGKPGRYAVGFVANPQTPGKPQYRSIKHC